MKADAPLPHAAADVPPTAAPATPDSARCRCGLALPVSSRDLLQGHKALEILHDGMVYRLQVTRAGKLILTK